MIKLKDMLEDLEFGKVYTDKDRPPFEVNESRANVLKAIKIAKNMGGDMTGAVKKIEKIQKGLSKQIEVEDALRTANESDLPTTTKKGKTVRAVHKKSGKEIVSVDTPSSRKKLKRMGFVVKEA